MASIEPLKPLDDDGLPTPKIGVWGEEKYRHIFCEIKKENTEALEKRCRREFPNRRVAVVTGDANLSADSIIAEMPRAGKSHRVLGFCFLDPFQMQNLYFSTIRTLSQRFMDFLVLIYRRAWTLIVMSSTTFGLETKH